jgi:hypothetical protein
LRRELIHEIAFSQPTLGAVTTGRITREEWVREIGLPVGNSVAVLEWAERRPTIDVDLLALVDEVRSSGTATAVLTNGTDTVAAELAEAGIDRRFVAEAPLPRSTVGSAWIFSGVWRVGR